MPEADATAPAQSESSAPSPSTTAAPAETAVDRAVASNDVNAFFEARRAERQGTPKPVTPPADAPAGEAKATPEGRTTSKRQDDINARMRDAVDRATADLRAEIARLRADAGRSTPPPPAAQAPAPEPPQREKYMSWETYHEKNPEATYDDYVDDKAEFRFSQLRDADRQEQQRAHRGRAIQAQEQTFLDRIKKHGDTDPEFFQQIAPGLLNALVPTYGVPPGQKPGAINALADELLKSPHAPQYLKHFSAHPEDFHALLKLAPTAFYRRLGVMEAAFEGAAARPAEQPAAPKPVTRMPTAQTLTGRQAGDTSDPEMAAVASGDVQAFFDAKLRKRAASQR